MFGAGYEVTDCARVAGMLVQLWLHALGGRSGTGTLWSGHYCTDFLDWPVKYFTLEQGHSGLVSTALTS